VKAARVRYRRAGPADYSEILRLNRTNFRANLSEEERAGGFLSAVFSAHQIAAMAQDLGILIAEADGQLAGFLCALRQESDHGSPVLAAMLAAYERLRFDEKFLSEYRSYIYGPVCIDRPFRRQGLLRGLHDAQLRELAGKFEIGVGLVSRDNPHSLDAHLRGLGMAEAGDFEVNGNVYATIVFRVDGR
jgi:hypothetical protein